MVSKRRMEPEKFSFIDYLRLPALFGTRMHYRDTPGQSNHFIRTFNVRKKKRIRKRIRRLT